VVDGGVVLVVVGGGLVVELGFVVLPVVVLPVVVDAGTVGVTSSAKSIISG
jgi:hypothetical protein